MLLAALALALMCLAFAGVFLIARRLDNYGVVDIAWSYAFGAVALLYAALAPGWGPRRWVIAAVVVLWSCRLGTYLYLRVMGHHPEEDGRYREMRTRWVTNFAWEMCKFYQIQAVSVVVLAIPFWLATHDTAPSFRVVEYAALGLFAVAQAGEALADAQLARFKAEPANRGQVCDRGLWGYSRHPNYFFVWLTWMSFALYGVGASWGWVGFIAPAAILYLLLKVTGIPLTEAQAVRTKGEAYRAYQRRVSAFLPWWPKEAASASEPRG
jgi:steroid 5-alpha reductase family enzyme